MGSNFKVGGEGVSPEIASTLSTLAKTTAGKKVLEDGVVSNPGEANALLNVNGGLIVDGGDYEQIKSQLPDAPISADQFAAVAKLFEERFPRSVGNGFVGLSALFGSSPAAVPQPLDTTSTNRPNLRSAKGVEQWLKTTYPTNDALLRALVSGEVEKGIHSFPSELHLRYCNDSGLICLPDPATHLPFVFAIEKALGDTKAIRKLSNEELGHLFDNYCRGTVATLGSSHSRHILESKGEKIKISPNAWQPLLVELDQKFKSKGYAPLTQAAAFFSGASVSISGDWVTLGSDGQAVDAQDATDTSISNPVLHVLTKPDGARYGFPIQSYLGICETPWGKFPLPDAVRHLLKEAVRNGTPTPPEDVRKNLSPSDFRILVMFILKNSTN